MTDFADDDVMRKALRQPFPREQIGKLPRTEKRPALDFVGHAAVTDRLNAHAPGWFYTVDELFWEESVVWIRGTFTVGGVSRPEYGDGKDPKEAIGNFIRRGAMRFGVALDLWSREELTANLQASAETTGPAPSSPPVPKQAAAPSERDQPASADGGPTPASPGAPPTSSPSLATPVASGGDETSAAPEAAGTEAGGARQVPTGNGEGPVGTEGSPQPPNSRRDQLWNNLVQFAGSKRKALNAVNTTMKASWTEPHIADIPEDDIEHTLRAYMQRESVA